MNYIANTNTIKYPYHPKREKTSLLISKRHKQKDDTNPTMVCTDISVTHKGLPPSNCKCAQTCAYVERMSIDPK